ncbi:MAG TPA: Spy/CpxP family protein refolding chaperone [Vicinamibacterales bacterium]
MRATRTVFLMILLATASAASAAGLPRHDFQRPQQAGQRDPQLPAHRGPRMKWWQDERYKSELRLTADQSARIEEVFQSSYPKQEDLFKDFSRREEQLSNLIAGQDVTEAEVIKQADQLEAVRASLGKARILMLYRMRRVLSPDQRQRLLKMQKEDERQRSSERDGRR